MMTSIHRFVLLLAGLALAGGFSNSESHAVEAGWLPGLQALLRQASDTTEYEVFEYLIEQEMSGRLSEYLYAPEARFGTLREDMDGDGKSDLAIAEIVTPKSMRLFVLDGGDGWAAGRPLELALPLELRFARGMEILRLDLNGDGIKDFYPRILDGVRRSQSIDCPVIAGTGGIGAASGQCLAQDQAVEELERDGYVYSGVQPDLFQYSHIADLNGDGRYEIVVTRFFEPAIDCGRACVSLWPDVYEWTPDSGYREANRKYPAFHNAFRAMLTEALRTGKAGSDLAPAYREMIAKIDALRPQ